MAQQRFVAFDLGAESGRAVLGTLDGARLELAEKHRFANPNGRMHGRLQHLVHRGVLRAGDWHHAHASGRHAQL